MNDSYRTHSGDSNIDHRFASRPAAPVLDLIIHVNVRGGPSALARVNTARLQLVAIASLPRATQGGREKKIMLRFVSWLAISRRSVDNIVCSPFRSQPRGVVLQGTHHPPASSPMREEAKPGFVDFEKV